MAEPELRGYCVAYSPYELYLRGYCVAYTPIVNASPAGTPTPLNMSVVEGVALAGPRTITFTDADSDTLTINETAGRPSWCNPSLTFPHVDVSPYDVLTYSGTPPFTGAGSSSGSPYSWTVTINDGVNPAVSVTVNLTVTNSNRGPTSNPASPIALSATVGQVFSQAIVFSDLDLENVTITRVGAKPAWLTEDKDTTGGTGYAVPVTLNLGGTPPDTTGTPWAFQYNIFDGITTANVLVNLTIAAAGVPASWRSRWIKSQWTRSAIRQSRFRRSG